MRTRSQSRNNFSQQEASPAIVETLRIELPFLEDQFQEDPPEDPPEVPMADNRTTAACPHHGFFELHQLDTFYNALNVNDQDSLNSAASAISSDVAELKDMVRALLLDKKNQSSAPAHSPTPVPVKAVEPNCVTCGGAHSYQNCPATKGNVYRDNIQDIACECSCSGHYPRTVGSLCHRLILPPTAISNKYAIEDPQKCSEGHEISQKEVQTKEKKDSIPVKGKGECILPGGKKINGVLYIPDFKCNLLSVNRLCNDLQCFISFFPNFWVMLGLRKRNLIGMGRCQGGLYKMKMTRERKAMATTIKTWHKRLGHESKGKLA
nr:hypothetical protein [Tanacetum cinerariifolium]